MHISPFSGAKLRKSLDMCKILKKKLHVSKKYCNFAAILHINCSELVKPQKRWL